jgi:gamma-glutamylcyclotransferase (GGCT)/AIG2-like uncharacterized protein YtfP
MALPLFVYGTLKRSAAGAPHALLRDARAIGSASMSGSMYDLGRYPGVYRRSAPGRRVFGELYELPEESAAVALRKLDRYEGSEFIRQRVFVTLRDGRRRAAWTYVLRRRPQKSARALLSGRYQPKRGAA